MVLARSAFLSLPVKYLSISNNSISTVLLLVVKNAAPSWRVRQDSTIVFMQIYLKFFISFGPRNDRDGPFILIRSKQPSSQRVDRGRREILRSDDVDDAAMDATHVDGRSSRDNLYWLP